MSLRRLAPLAIASLVLTHCATESADDGAGGGGMSNAGSGNATGGSAGSAGSTAGSTSSGGIAGASGGSGGSAATAGAGTSGTSGASTGGGGGALGGAGSTGGAGAASGGSSGSGGGSTGGGGAGGASGGAGKAGAGGAAAGSGGGGAFTLTSSKLVPDMEMSSDFTCAGDAHSPPLAWAGAPAGTMSFAMVFVDTTIIDANMTDSRGYHSAIWDIPASVSALPEDLPVGAMITTPVMAKQFNPLRAAYLGPCPNNGAAPADTYEFRLFALPVTTLTGQLNNVRNILQSIMAAGPLGTAVLRVRSDATGTLK
jgi:Raf kinase inhibitor-like YbhB/YbcL family protein